MCGNCLLEQMEFLCHFHFKDRLEFDYEFNFFFFPQYDLYQVISFSTACFKDGKEVYGNDCYPVDHRRKKAALLAGK